MDTTYYNFETRKIKVSGGPDLLTIVPAAVTAPAGEVLDFDRCRRKLETKAAWKGLAKAVAEAKTPAVEDAEDEVYEAVAPVEERPAPAKRAPAEAHPVACRVRTAESKPRKAVRAPRQKQMVGWLELLSSVAVILVCLCAGWAFLALV